MKYIFFTLTLFFSLITHQRAFSTGANDLCSPQSALQHVFEHHIEHKKLISTQGKVRDVFVTTYQEHEAIFLKNRNLEKSASPYRYADAEMKQRMAAMTTKDAYEAIDEVARRKRVFDERPLAEKRSDPSPFLLTEEEKYNYPVADNLTAFDLLKRAEPLRFEGHPIAPAPYAIVRNADHVPTGALIEKIPGENLLNLRNQNRLTKSQLDEIFRQIVGEVKVLHANGIAHGDLTAANIMVDLSKPDSPSVRLIDLVRSRDPLEQTLGSDWKTLKATASELRHYGDLKIGYESVLEKTVHDEGTLSLDGGAHIAMHTTWERNPAVFLENKELRAHILYDTTPEAQKQCAEMSVPEAYQTLDRFDQRKPGRISADEDMFKNVAEVLTGFDLVSRASRLRFEGRPIVAEPYAIVRNKAGIPTGSILEFVPGEVIEKWFGKGKEMDPALKEEIFRQLIGQVKVLHANGLMHADLHELNILLDLSDSAQPKVRLIDLRHESREKIFYNGTDDWSRIRKLAKKLGYEKPLDLPKNDDDFN